MSWIVNNVQTGNCGASVGELVQVDMRGKAYPDAVVVTLPAPNTDNKGAAVKVVTVNSGGCEDGSVLRVETPSGLITPPGASFVQDVGGGEQFYEFISNGADWVVTSL